MPKSKKGPKATAPINNSSLPNPPSPFTAAPDALKSFLSTLPPKHIYILSLDNHPIAQKRRIFAVPLLLNIFLSLILLYRLQYAIPTYTSFFLAILGYDSPAKVNTKAMSTGAVLGLGASRAGMMMGDFVMVRFVGMWPFGFFLGGGIGGEEGPVRWRREIGWRDVEVVVRRGRKWERECFGEDGVKEEWLREGKEGRVVRERISPAVRKAFIKGKTSYMMLDRDWDLDFGGMIEAHGLIDQGKMKIEDFKTAVLVYSERWGWLVWEVWKEHDEGSEDEGTRKLQLIKDKLTVLGKENLFFRWIEVVQSETSQPGAFTKERQGRAVRKIRAEFEDRGVDFDEFWGEVGGVENMPGMEITG